MNPLGLWEAVISLCLPPDGILRRESPDHKPTIKFDSSIVLLFLHKHWISAAPSLAQCFLLSVFVVIQFWLRVSVAAVCCLALQLPVLLILLERVQRTNVHRGQAYWRSPVWQISLFIFFPSVLTHSVPKYNSVSTLCLSISL